jgi:hypothetical protein
MMMSQHIFEKLTFNQTNSKQLIIIAKALRICKNGVVFIFRFLLLNRKIVGAIKH